MKVRFLIGFVFLALVACRNRVETQNLTSPQPGASSELSAIDSLMWRQPDSALMVLMDYFTSRDSADSVSTTAFDGHYAQLLAAELLYKNDYPQTNRLDLLRAVDYFDSLITDADGADTRGKDTPNVSAAPSTTPKNATPNDIFLAARAHYIKGVGYYENDSVVPACKEYLKALEIMEGHFGEKDLVGKKAKFMALAFTHLTSLFSDFYLHEQAIYFGKLSLAYFRKYDASPQHVAWVLDEIGSHYEMTNYLDSAEFYYNKGLEILPDTNNMTFRDITTRQALLSYTQNHHLEKALATLQHLADFAENDIELSARYLSIAEIYYSEQQFDSAMVYFEYVYNNALSYDSRLLSANRLQEIFKTKGDTLKANEYALVCSQFVSPKDKEGELHSSLTALCQQYEQGKREILHKREIQRTVTRWSIILGIAVIVVVLVSLFWVISKKQRSRLERQKNSVEQVLGEERNAHETTQKKMNLELEKKNEDIKHLKGQLENVQYSHKIEQSALSNRLKRSNEELRELKSQMKRQKNAVSPKNKVHATTFSEEPICQLIMKRVCEGQFKSKVGYLNYKEYALDKKQLLALRQAADSHFNQFTNRLVQTYPTLTKGDLDYCCLYLLNLTEADISALMQRAYNTVNERSSKLKHIFGGENALSVLLLRIASETSSS